MIRNNIVSGGPTLCVPAHLSIGKYFLEKMCDICQQSADRIALLNGSTGEQLTYGELLQRTVRTGAALRELGVTRGSVLAFLSENRNELIPAYMAALCCGATITLYNKLYTKDELNHVINISKPTIVICSHDALINHMDILKNTDSVEHIVQINGEVVDGAVSLDEMLRKVEVDPWSYEPEPVDGASDTALILYSSGTTGLPKGAMITHLNFLYAVVAMDSGYFNEVSERIITALPWYHCYGLVTIINSLLNRALCAYLAAFKPDRFLEIIQNQKIIGMFSVPPIIVFLAKSALVEKYDLTSLKCFWCGAAPISQQTLDELKIRLPNMTLLLQGYGLTESTLAVLKQRDERDSEPGMLPVPGCKFKVIDTNTGEKLGPNENGELRVKTPSLMKGYVNNEEATKAIFDEDGYLKTGDIGFYDEKGQFSIVDRLKEIIKYKGYQVAPAAVESVLLQHAGVAECGVVGAPDDRAGELPAAFVVPKPGVKLTEQELLDFTNDKLSSISRIRGGIIFIEEIPKSAAGKILRRVLKQKLLDKHSQ